jgi:hypothetical protein
MNVIPRATTYKSQNTVIEIRNVSSSATPYTGQKAIAFFILKTKATKPCSSGHKLLVPKENKQKIYTLICTVCDSKGQIIIKWKLTIKQ